MASLAIAADKLWRDRAFGTALVAAPLFWGALLVTKEASPDAAWPLRSPGQFAMLVLVFPLLEELAFRGFLQGALRKSAWGRKSCFGFSVANAVTSTVFALVHFFRHPLLWAALVFFPSLIFGFFRDRYGTLPPSIILHIFYNAGYFWLFGAPLTNP